MPQATTTQTSQQQQQPFFQQQPFQQQQPIFNQFTNTQPQMQTDQFNSFFNGTSTMDPFSPNNFAAQQQQPMHTGQNPFLPIMSQQQQSPAINVSPYATMGQTTQDISSSPVDMNSSNNNQFLNTHHNNNHRAATLSVIGSSNTGNYNSNPFRSLSMRGVSPYNQQQRQIPVLKPVPYPSSTSSTVQRQSTLTHNPFSNASSPATPPLTPNQQMSLNMFMPQQQQQQTQSPYNTTAGAPNPFNMIQNQQQQQQQHNIFNNPPPTF